MYVLEISRRDNRNYAFVHEMTADEYRNAKFAETSDCYYTKISASVARYHVKHGTSHSTGYWLDGNTVRYAAAQYD